MRNVVGAPAGARKRSSNASPIEARLDALIKKAGPDDCWIAQGSIDVGCGYPRISVRGEKKYVHHLVFELANGPIPSGSFALHKCDCKTCGNPSHLYAGSQLDNASDAKANGRLRRHLREDQVLAIRNMRFPNFPRMSKGAGYSEIAKAFGVSHQTVFNICTGRTWRAVTGVNRKVMSMPVRNSIRAAAPMAAAA